MAVRAVATATARAVARACNRQPALELAVRVQRTAFVGFLLFFLTFLVFWRGSMFMIFFSIRFSIFSIFSMILFSAAFISLVTSRT